MHSGGDCQRGRVSNGLQERLKVALPLPGFARLSRGGGVGLEEKAQIEQTHTHRNTDTQTRTNTLGRARVQTTHISHCPQTTSTLRITARPDPQCEKNITGLRGFDIYVKR